MTNPTGTLYLIPSLLAEDSYHQAFPAFHKEIIQSIDYFFAEELRTARRFLSKYQLGKPIEQLQFFELNKDTSKATVATYFKEIPPDKNIGILSEAGCPGVADPGAVAVNYAHKMGMKVKPLVGPSSILLALMASGLSGQSFTFYGYLPIEKAERIKAIKELEADAKANKRTQIFMETPYRNNPLFNDLITQCQPTTLLCVAANIMALDETIVTKTIADWKQKPIDLHKKPTIFLMY